MKKALLLFAVLSCGFCAFGYDLHGPDRLTLSNCTVLAVQNGSVKVQHAKGLGWYSIDGLTAAGTSNEVFRSMVDTELAFQDAVRKQQLDALEKKEREDRKILVEERVKKISDDAGTGRMGMTEAQCRAKYGEPLSSTNDFLVFSIENFQMGVKFVGGRARAYTYHDATGGLFLQPIKSADVENIMSLFSGGKRWAKIDLYKLSSDAEAGPKRDEAFRTFLEEYQWRRSDGRLSAVYAKKGEILSIIDNDFVRRTDKDRSAAIDRL